MKKDIGAFIAMACVGVICSMIGFKAGTEHGALAQKSGQITWTTNSVTNVTFKIKE